jgi:hypothetical protein
LPPASIGLEHRRRKAAAKLHVRLDLHSLLPRFVLVESAKAAEPHRLWCKFY